MFDYNNAPKNIEYKFYEKFDNDIYDEVSHIQKGLDRTREDRAYILSKLQNMAEEVFCTDGVQGSTNSPKKPAVAEAEDRLASDKVPRIEQFGSLITGLALESSDMDMAVTNLFLPDRQKMLDCLDMFAEKLGQWTMIKDLNAIATASIPVIKANIDLNKLRETEINLKGDSIVENHNDFGQT